jgi:MFS family permease
MMSQSDPRPIGQPQDISLAAAEAQYQQSLKAVGIVMDDISPWLFEVGSWIFGGLIAFTLLVLASLLTVGPVDLSVKLSTVTFAVSLPLNATGLILLRLVRDLKPLQLEGITQAFQEAGLTPGQQQIPSVASLKEMRERGSRTVLSTTMGILGLSGVLTIVGITAALWHMSWWIGVAFLVTVLISLVIIQIALATSQPPVPAEEKTRRRRYRNELLRQAKERSRQ